MAAGPDAGNIATAETGVSANVRDLDAAFSAISSAKAAEDSRSSVLFTAVAWACASAC